MTTYDQIISRGKEEGMKRVIVNTVLNGYKKGHSIEILADITELSIEEVRKIIREHNG